MKFRIVIAAAITVLAVGVMTAVGAPAQHQSTGLLTLPGFVPVDGASGDITRSNGGATIKLKTSGLVPGNVYTAWSISFSNPSACTSGGAVLPDGSVTLCGPGDDIPGGVAGFEIQQIAGHVTGASGNVNLGGHVDVMNPFGAEFHVVIAEHGALDPANMPTQIMSPAPGAQIAFFIPQS